MATATCPACGREYQYLSEWPRMWCSSRCEELSKPALIPDDKATKPSIVDEMARAMACCDEVSCGCAENARAAAAVVARRLREAIDESWDWMPTRISVLIAELEGS